MTQVNLLGEKVVDPLIHSCEKCSLPILLYGRMVCLVNFFVFFASDSRLEVTAAVLCYHNGLNTVLPLISISEPIIHLLGRGHLSTCLCTYTPSRHNPHSRCGTALLDRHLLRLAAYGNPDLITTVLI